MIEILSGHKKPECDGKWIDVGTLMNPRDQMCTVCRGHRQKPLVEPEPSETVELEEATPWTEEDLKMLEDVGDPMPGYTRISQIVWYVLVAVAIMGAVVLIKSGGLE